eukprot:scaffold368_cov258-Pinguiococcus_pyrenoidosus.AAC.73
MVRRGLSWTSASSAATSGGSEYLWRLIQSSLSGPQHADERSIEGLAMQVRLLSELVKNQNNGGVTVVTGNERGRQLQALLALLAIGSAAAYAKGVTVQDVAWVSKATFKIAQRTIGCSIDHLKKAILTLRGELTGKIEAVDDRVAELAEAQATIGEDVKTVGKRVDEVGDDVGKIDDLLQDMQAQLDGLMARQDYTNRGIYILCAMVAQMFLIGRANETSSPANLEQRTRLVTQLNAYIDNFDANAPPEDGNRELLHEARRTLALSSAEDQAEPSAADSLAVPDAPAASPAKESVADPESKAAEQDDTDRAMMQGLLANETFKYLLSQMNQRQQAHDEEPEQSGEAKSPEKGADAPSVRRASDVRRDAEFEDIMRMVSTNTEELMNA